jgi:hypothetical protein
MSAVSIYMVPYFSTLILQDVARLSELNLDLSRYLSSCGFNDLAGEVGSFTDLGKATQEVGRCRIDRIFRAIA